MPRFYDEVVYDGFRALVLSDIGGVTLWHFPCEIEVDDMQNKIENAFRGLAACGVRHGDPKLHNLILVDDLSCAMVVDFEYAELDSPTNWDKSAAKGDAEECYKTDELEKRVMRESARRACMTLGDRAAEVERQRELAKMASVLFRQQPCSNPGTEEESPYAD